MSDNKRVNSSKERADAELVNAAAAAGSHPDIDEEVSVIQNMTSFLLEHGGAEVDSKVLRTIAEALSKRLNDTSPSTLKDVTMEHSYGVGFPCVSLQGQGSTSPPVQGRSVREFEEQMASLRKENFNLKLRLYFLEESVPGYHQANADGHESFMKQLIETKVEIEILRKELEQKQELLKEAAQAMNHMEQIQKETETKGQAFIEELKQKIQFLEMERDLDKTHQSGFMNDLLGHSEISENVNTLQKIRELEGMVTQSEDKIKSIQAQNSKFEELLAKRDETIKEYEEKVKELAFQNAELLEMMENKEKDMINVELNLKSLRLCNADLKEDNRNLIEALKSTQDNFRKEFSNMKVCEKRMREQQDALSKMQSTISLKTANTARLLERIQDYEKMVTKMNFERNLAKRENRFFRAIIGKLQRSKNECFTIEKEEFYQQYAHEYDEKPVDCNKQYEMNYRDMLKGRGDFHGEYLLKQKLLVNYSNNAKYSSKVVEKCEHDLPESKALVKCCYLNEGCAHHRGSLLSHSDDGNGYGGIGLSCDELEDGGGPEPAFPIRYTISDASMFAGCDAAGLGGACISRSGSCTSLQANFSAASLYCGDAESPLDRECLQRDLKEKKIALADKLCELDDTQQELQQLRKSYDTACRTLQQLLQREKNQQQDGGGNRALSDSEALQNHLQKCEHENTIKNLEAEVKKKTAALQNLVNNELWQKNREIERLTKLVNANTTSPLSPTAARKNLESLQLQQSFTESDYTKALEHNKLLQRKVDVLNQRLVSGRSNEALIEELRLEARTARAEADNAETCRHAYAKVFGALSDRLYELAGFLNSLMKHKEVLSFLSTDRRRAMRTAVDCSLDLSTSIRETLTTGDQSFEGLSNLSRLLLDEDELEVGLANKTFNSHEHLRTRHSFDVLRSENKALRKILDSRRSCGGTADYVKDAKDRRSLPPFLLDNLSESEAWSEPDRQVSLARIGLEEHAAGDANVSAKDAISKQTPPSADTDSESESDALQQSRTTKQRNQERITQLEKLIAQRDERILMVQFQLVEADNNLKKESLRAISLTQEVEQLRQRNEELITDLIAIGSEQSRDSTAATDTSLYNKTLMQRQIDDKIRAVEQLQEERDRIAVEARLAEVQVGALKAEIEDIKQKYEIQLKLASDKERQRLDKLKHELEELMQQRLKEQERIHKDTLMREWIARTTYEECKAQLTELQTQYVEAQRTIDYLTDNEQDLKQTLINSEMEVRSLKKQLDESVLQASKFVSERTKLCNEKLQLEKRLMDLQQQLSTADIQHTTTLQRVTELEALQQTLSEQLLQAQAALAAKRLNASDASQSGYASDEVQKSSTKRESNSSPDLGIHSDTGRVSSVELSNLQHSLLKTVPMPSGGEKASKEEMKYSLQDKSNINALVSKRAQHSSSSDLGIESDTGRMSSMDIKNESPTRTDTDESSNTENKMSVANVNTSATATTATNAAGSHPIHDCIKVEQENAELRRKLVQTKRAFEETYKKLHIANQRKETFQKEIKDQILKTKNVLKYARLHMSKVQQPNVAQQQEHHHQTEAQEQDTQQQQHHHQQQLQQRNVTNDCGASTSKSSSDARH